MIAAAPRDEWRVRLPDTRLLIDGEFVDAMSGERFDTYAPSTEQVIASVSRAGPQDADRAVAAAEIAALEALDAAMDNYAEKKAVWVDLLR